LATATQQIEKPRITVENAANRLVGVPAGKMANFPLLLTNESETGEDCYFSLFVIDETNTLGAGIDINSNEIGSGRRVLVPAGGTVRMNLELEKNNEGDLLYENIAVVLASECQSDPASTWEVIGDTVYISAEFVPTSTDVALRIDNTVVNTSTKGMLPMTVSGYDPNYVGLKYIAVQYQGVGETAWHDARKYVMTENDIVNPQIEEVLPANGIINLNFDMTNGAVFPDRTYKFRALSARTYGDGEVTNASDEILVVKDMNRPKPLGQPQPTDGILSAGDELSILFNEAILNGELTKDKNFRITGVLNGSEVAHQTALELENTAQTAATEASINLAGKDFSIDMWMKANGAGTLLSHGTGTQKLIVGVDADSKLMVKIGDQAYTSLNNVPLGQWAFLTLSLTADGKLSASVAAGSETTTLFSELAATAYEGNGPLAVGQQMTGAMHELLLWDEMRNVATALQQRSVTKTPSTQGLIGYWKMDEGEGTVITDYARNRHMTMAAETWHIENENKAVTLDGEHYVGINTANIPPMPQDDYAVELWVKTGEQTAAAQLLQMGEVGLVLNTDGSLSLESNNAQLSTLNAQLNDNAWHHVALSVLRGGNANVYVDGVAKATVSADKVGSLGSDQLLIGARRTFQDVQQSDVLYTYDRPLTATIDEVRIWNATMNANQLKKQRKVRLTGTEPGLVAYYPFESKTLDGQNQVVTNGSAADLCNSGFDAQLSELGGSSDVIDTYTDAAPALRVKPEEENVSFTFVASDNKIVIDIDEAPARIEGTTLNFTVRDVHDQNGNLSEPVTWSAFVNHNPLAWKESTLAVATEVTAGATLTATLVNKSGQQQVWTMSDLPSWLEADIIYGDLQPLAEQTITFTVSEATPIGKYEKTVYVAGNDGIKTPLTLNITVTGNVPGWAVNPHDFETSMNLIAVLKNDDTPMTDPDDLMAAFVGEECRGVAHPEYNERYGNYYVTMDIYGASAESGQEVTFRAYDASTGTVYPVVTLESNEAFTFIPLTLMGTYAEPNVFIIRNLIEQELELKAGWNWVSFNVAAEDMTVPAIFEKIADDVIVVKGQMSSLTPEEGEWDGNLNGSLTNTEMYAVKMATDRILRIVGTSVNTPVPVYAGWNWLGYYGRQVSSLGDALAYMQKDNGDILKAQRGVAYWDVNSWSGSLMMMEPGLGYQFKSSNDKQTFSYPSAATAGARQLTPGAAPAMENGRSSIFSPVNFRNYPDNAIMAVKVVADSKTLAGVEVAAFAGDECRTAAFTNDEGIAFLTIPGDETCELTFQVAVDGEVVVAPLTLTYETDAIYGTPKHPVLMNLGAATGIREMLYGNGMESIYDLSGRKIQLDGQTRKLQKGVYIINGQKQTVK
ncbi:MAG: LamG domain-containing protein, partial [Prevotella sp.]|nr:LamG domain-containing protein [Prevotella sp.]